MSVRFADFLMYVLLAGIGGVVLWQSYGLPNPFGGSIGSGGFPGALAVAMILLCAIGAVRSLTHSSREKLEFPGLGKMAVTLAALIALFGSWQAFGHFFPLAFVFLSGLLIYYASDEKLTWRIVLASIVGSAVLLWLISLFFTHVLYVRF